MLRLLGYEQYGLWITIISVVNIACLIDPGFAVSTTVFLSKDKSINDANSFSRSLVSSFIILLLYSSIASLSLFFFAESISSIFTKFTAIDKITFVSSIRVGSLLVFCLLAQQFLIGVEQSYLRYKAINIIDALQLLLISIGGIFIALHNKNIYTLIQWQTFLSAIFLGGHLTFSYSLVKSDLTHLKFSYNRTKEILKYGFSNWLSILSMGLFSRADRLIVGSILGSNSLSIYAVLLECSSIITSFTTRAVSPLLPLISSSYQNDLKTNQPQINFHEKKFDFIFKFLKINLFISCGIGTLIIVSSPLIVSLLLPGQLKYQNILGLQLIALLTTLSSISATGYFLLLGLKKNFWMTIIFLFSSLLALSLIAFASLKMGIIGSLIGNIGWVLTASITFIALKQIYHSNNKVIRWLIGRILFFIVINITITIAYNIIMNV
jgi:O-antigen/teichoic acid export membrane protein